MELDITMLNRGMKDVINIDSVVTIPNDKFHNIEILDLRDLRLCGTIARNSSDIITLEAELSGIMVLEDSISLEPINYQFSCQIDEEFEEFNENLENILDITDILWQNIILEVPLKLTNVENFNEYQGDGWKLVSEDSIKNTSNPFSELKDMMGEE